MNIFRIVNELEGVEAVRNLYSEVAEQPLDLIFFTCPKVKGSRRRSRIRVNTLKTGLETTYVEGISEKSLAQAERAVAFMQILSGTGIKVSSLINIFGSADALILFPIPVDLPPVPQFEGVKMVPNHLVVLDHFFLWAELYRRKPWLDCPRWARKMERERLLGLQPAGIPENLAQDLVQRVFAGFALDGILIRQGKFGTRNPVILGVESPGVGVLQSAALPKEEWLPVIQLAS